MNLSKLSNLVHNHTLWNSFVEYIEEEQKVASLKLAIENNHDDMLRLQGHLRCLREFTKLREKVLAFDRLKEE